ncbi:hypothetical protein [Stenotrophobium rhamnosiphilum]|uniref:Uncharacterized protein n=1 Tax=Stenotrophobium rhamnosiphilum TaxID=2029166 RepID=A0A2T5MIK5_9GAMM|nr:hypothetical protein [Stenotrophobium rhamnosiphilum]PTU32405.1 hypothetical protein CJD38_07080 [Stenotrophobium rhamnosiphilum]
MHNYSHKKVIETIAKLDAIPANPEEYAEWITAEAHLAFLRINAVSDELVIFANGEYSFVDSVVVPNKLLARMTPEQLEQWHFEAYAPIASFVSGGGKEGVWIERDVRHRDDEHLKAARLVFNRTFEGWEGSGRSYVEVNQEFTHVTGVHWRPEKRAYCRFDSRGDLEAAVSVTTREDKGSRMTLVTFKWDALEEYLSAADAVLLRRFDFTLLRRGGFNGWPQTTPESVRESNELFYRRLILHGHAAYTAGRQIIRPRRSQQAISTAITNSWGGTTDKKYAEFLAYDWRNNKNAMISASPEATTNYFDAKDNPLPFELSPAFFRPEVLSKYKTDRDKYTLAEREVTCRTAWRLKGIDVNEAGQVHAYICDLRRLPYEEQLHWLGHNESPKASISKRAFINDFEGKFVHFTEPPAAVLSTVRRWHDEKVSWWALRDQKLLGCVNTPLTASRDEWAEAFMDLAKLVVEGFETSSIRAKLDAAKLVYSKDDRTITLLEKLLNKDAALSDQKKLVGLRTVQSLRSKAKGHAGGSEAEELAQNALMQHETFANHFKYVCGLLTEELAAIEGLFA